MWLSSFFCDCHILHCRKRHRAWSNTPRIGALDRGCLKKKARKEQKVKTTIRKKKADGKHSFSGTKWLKSTQWGPKYYMQHVKQAIKTFLTKHFAWLKVVPHILRATCPKASSTTSEGSQRGSSFAMSTKGRAQCPLDVSKHVF